MLNALDSAQPPTDEPSPPTATAVKPPTRLWTDPSFIGLSISQFFGAFNDNLYKQLILLLALPLAVQGVAPAAANAAEQDVQGYASVVFALPFVLFSGLAGYLSDRFSKSRIIVAAKIAEIVIMLAAGVAFWMYDWLGSAGTWTVLFILATQSAFFGPSKYGILPQLFSSKQLPTVNGFILMTTFLSIITGTLVAGAIFDWVQPQPQAPVAGEAVPEPEVWRMWKAAAICIGLAVVGTLAAVAIRYTRPSQPQARLSLDSLWIDRHMLRLLRSDRPLLAALLVSCVFWMVSGMALPVINRLGLLMEVSKFATSALMGATAFGIMAGSIIVIAMQSAGRASPRREVFLGLWGMTIALFALATYRGGGQPIFGYWGAFTLLLLLGISAAIYAVPLQVFLQERPPEALKGRMIATMNWANFVGILLAGPLYQLSQWLVGEFDQPVILVFALMGFFVLPLALFYRLNPDAPKPKLSSGGSV